MSINAEIRTLKLAERTFKDLDESVKQIQDVITQTTNEIDSVIDTEERVVLPAIEQLNEQSTEHIGIVIRESVSNAIVSMNGIITDVLRHVNQNVVLSKETKDILANLLVQKELEYKGKLNEVTSVLLKLNTLMGERFQKLVTYVATTMTDLRTTLAKEKLKQGEESCCFKRIPYKEDPYLLHQMGFFYTKVLDRTTNADYPATVNMDFIKKVHLLASFGHTVIEEDKTFDQVERIFDAKVAALSTQVTVVGPKVGALGKIYLEEKRDLVTEIRDDLKLIRGDNEKKIALRILKEVPVPYIGENKVPLLYCNEHSRDLVDIVKGYGHTEIGCRVCSYHKKLLEDAEVSFRWIQKQAPGMDTVDEPVYYIKIG